MSPKLEELTEQAKKIAENAGEQLNSFRDSEEYERIKKVAGELGEEAAIFVRKYPLQSVFGAAVAGFLLGNLGRRK